MKSLIGILVTLGVLTQIGGRPRPFGPGVCGPIDSTYIRTATETGGQPFPMAPAEISKMAVILSESSRSDATMLLWAGGTSADAGREFVVPIDPSIERVTFSVTFDGKGGGVEIVPPDGAVITPDARHDDTILNCGRILSIDAPAAGAWRVIPKPTDRFWLVVHGRSDRDLQSAEFVRAGGRPGHEGLFRIHGMPIVGRPATLRVRLAEPEATPPDFVLLSSQGRPLQGVALGRVDPDEFVGEIELPAVPFRVAMTGTDSTGALYQRVYKTLLRAESVEVVPSSVNTIEAARDSVLAFTVRNYGPRARYRITAMVGAEILNRVQPASAEIDQNGEQRVNVWVPAGTIAAAGASLELLVVASTEASTPASSNSALQQLSIVKD
jgi:hypothetical protein